MQKFTLEELANMPTSDLSKMVHKLIIIYEHSNITMNTLKGVPSNQGLDSNELRLHRTNQFHGLFLNGSCNCNICIRLLLYIEDNTLEV
jgi:hypothetical protein